MRRRVFLGGQAVSMLGDGLAVLAIPLLVLRVTSSPEAAVLASLPGSVGYLAAGIPAGVVADRLDPWLVLGGGDVLRALILLAGDPRPVLASAGLLTILCAGVAWLAALRKEDGASVAAALLGR